MECANTSPAIALNIIGVERVGFSARENMQGLYVLGFFTREETSQQERTTTELDHNQNLIENAKEN